VRELEESASGQYLLTEVLLLEHVDRIIAAAATALIRALASEASRAARRAARPTHLGSNRTPAGERGATLEPGDLVVVVGAAALPAALFIAAHDAEVFPSSITTSEPSRGRKPGRHGAARRPFQALASLRQLVPGRGAEPGDHRSLRPGAGARARPSRAARRLQLRTRPAACT